MTQSDQPANLIDEDISTTEVICSHPWKVQRAAALETILRVTSVPPAKRIGFVCFFSGVPGHQSRRPMQKAVEHRYTQWNNNPTEYVH